MQLPCLVKVAGPLPYPIQTTSTAALPHQGRKPSGLLTEKTNHSEVLLLLSNSRTICSIWRPQAWPRHLLCMALKWTHAKAETCTSRGAAQLTHIQLPLS